MTVGTRVDKRSLNVGSVDRLVDPTAPKSFPAYGTAFIGLYASAPLRETHKATKSFTLQILVVSLNDCAERVGCHRDLES
jgi:hypothetical protein